MAHAAADTQFMVVAHRLAQAVPRRPWPNPPVGAVVVRDGEIVGRGAHHGPGTPHAERLALQEAGERARGATLYVTLEPCNHHGRTPPCAPLVADSGVARVVVGVRDPNPRVAGGGLALLRERGVAVTVGVLARGCLELIWPFAATDGFARPFVTLKTAVSLDGRFAPAAAPPGRPCYLTGEPARREVHRLRRWHDLVLVGGATARRDRPRLDGRLAPDDPPCPGDEPLPAVVTGDPARVAGWRADRHVVFASAGAGGAAPAAELVPCAAADGGVAPDDLLRRAAERGWWTILLEAGPRLAGAWLAAGLVDRWVQFTAPLVLGDGPGWSPFPAPGEPFHLTRTIRLAADACQVWDRRPFAQTRAALAAGPEGGA